MVRNVTHICSGMWDIVYKLTDVSAHLHVLNKLFSADTALELRSSLTLND